MNRLSLDRPPETKAADPPLRQAASGGGGAAGGSVPAGPVATLSPSPVAPGAKLDFAALRSQARLVGRELADQPIPIANHDHLLILKLLGG